MFYVLIVVLYFRLLQEGERRLKSLQSIGISDSESLKILKSLVLTSITFQKTVFLSPTTHQNFYFRSTSDNEDKPKYGKSERKIGNQSYKELAALPNRKQL